MRIDYRVFIWLFSLKELKSRIVRWIKVLFDYNFIIKYWLGYKYGNVDVMLRCENFKNCCCLDFEEEIFL